MDISAWPIMQELGVVQRRAFGKGSCNLTVLICAAAFEFIGADFFRARRKPNSVESRLPMNCRAAKSFCNQIKDTVLALFLFDQ